MNRKNYYVVKASIHRFEESIPETSTKLRYYDDELRESRFFNGSNFKDVIRMKLAYDADYSNYTIDCIMHVSI